MIRASLIENAATRSRWGSRWARWGVFSVIGLIGLAVRLPQLDVRPMHTDEAVNAYIVGQLLAGETFTYDPQDRHGPTLPALALPLARIQGARSFSDLTEQELRLTSVVAGVLTILLFGVAAEMFGFVPSLLAALIFAIAPLPVYYDRYFIHESLFCAATFGLILFAWRAMKTRSIGHAMLAGAFAAVMLASKETAVLHLLAIAIAASFFWFWNLRGKSIARSWRAGPLLAGTVVFLLLFVVLFSWFGRNWKAVLDLMRAAPYVLARAGGQGHQKPFWYYGRLLSGGWSGGLLLAVACLGILITLKKRDASPSQFFAYYGISLAAIYSFIPYKTPWLALNLWLPLALFTGVAIESLWRWATKKLPPRATVPVFCVLAAFAVVLVAHDTRQRAFLHPADETNPYAYAQTSDDILSLATEITDMARQNGISTPRIAVIASDPWPLPWYLRHFSQVGFWQPGQQPPEADFYITSSVPADQYADRLQTFRPEFFGVRPGVLILLWSPAPK